MFRRVGPDPSREPQCQKVHSSTADEKSSSYFNFAYFHNIDHAWMGIPNILSMFDHKAKLKSLSFSGTNEVELTVFAMWSLYYGQNNL